MAMSWNDMHKMIEVISNGISMCRCTLKLLRIVPIIVFTLSHSYQSTVFFKHLITDFKGFVVACYFNVKGN